MVVRSVPYMSGGVGGDGHAPRFCRRGEDRRWTEESTGRLVCGTRARQIVRLLDARVGCLIGDGLLKFPPVLPARS